MGGRKLGEDAKASKGYLRNFDLQYLQLHMPKKRIYDSVYFKLIKLQEDLHIIKMSYNCI